LRPDAEFRARLGAAFASGELARAAEPATATVVPLSILDRSLARYAALAAAAVLLLTLVPASLESGFRVLRGDAAGTWTLDGVSHSLADLGPDARLPGGAELHVEAGAVEVVFDDIIALRANTGTIVLPDPEAGPALRCTVRTGEAIFLTGPGFAGRSLAVTTPEGRVEVVGTAFAVWRDETVTCVCVLEGHASVGVHSTDLEPVPPGKRKVMPSEGVPAILDIMPEHRSGLMDFVERTRDTLVHP
jgi:ferric-dicitrate binding protein FerR (iron transport regulator)